MLRSGYDSCTQLTLTLEFEKKRVLVQRDSKAALKKYIMSSMTGSEKSAETI